MQPDTHTNGRIAHDPGDARVSTAVDPRTGRRLAVVAAALAVVLVGGFSVAFAVRHRYQARADDGADAAAHASDAVDVVRVEPTLARYPLSLPGQTAGWIEGPLNAQVDGIVHWTADMGDHVRRGQVLATIDTPELDQQLAAAVAKADAADAQVDVAQSNQSLAQLTYDRWRDSKPGVVSQQERDQKKADLAAATAHLAEARAQAKTDHADVARYQAMEAFRQVTADYDGVITARNINQGDLVTAGSSPAHKPMYTMAQSTVIRTNVDVPQKAVADLLPGTPATVTTDPYPGHPFAGTIARVAGSIDPATRTERVEVDVPNPDLKLLPGMYVSVQFQLAQRGLLQVPAAAILYRPGGLQVAVVPPDGRVQFRPVTVARDDGDTLELSAGVQPGDRVALNLSSAITPGQHVTAVEADATPTPAPAPVGPSGPAPTREPAPLPPNHAPLNRPAGGTTGGD